MNINTLFISLNFNLVYKNAYHRLSKHILVLIRHLNHSDIIYVRFEITL